MLLAGLLFAPDGQCMLHTFTRKSNARTYRYYVPYLHKRRHAGAKLDPNAPDIGPLPAAEIEMAVLEQIHAALTRPEMLVATWQACQGQAAAGAACDEAQVLVAMRRIGAVWQQLFPAEQQCIAGLLVERVELHGHGLDIQWRDDGWSGLGAEVSGHRLVQELRDQRQELIV